MNYRQIIRVSKRFNVLRSVRSAVHLHYIHHAAGLYFSWGSASFFKYFFFTNLQIDNLLFHRIYSRISYVYRSAWLSAEFLYCLIGRIIDCPVLICIIMDLQLRLNSFGCRMSSSLIRMMIFSLLFRWFWTV